MGVFLCSSTLQFWLSSAHLSANFISPTTWQYLVQVPPHAESLSKTREIPFGLIVLAVGIASVLTGLLGTIWLARSTHAGFVATFVQWGTYGWCWFCLMGCWEWAWIVAHALDWTSLSDLMAATPQFWLAGCMAGWFTTFFSMRSIAITASTTAAVVSGNEALPKAAKDHDSSRSKTSTNSQAVRWLCLASCLYIVIFTTMNWRLYFNLLVPHGDSVMYEEHLWNILHGKGFRSYLDQGLFFGEHVQFIHLFLLPFYVIWPSHLLLELCESTALSLGVFPIFWMTKRCLERYAGSVNSHQPLVAKQQATTLALSVSTAYLIYAPMQFLDIEIDLKTFRPEAFGVLLLLMTLDQLERRHFWGTLLGLAWTLTVKEDYAIVFGPLGLWIALRELTVTSGDPLGKGGGHRRSVLLAGIALSVFSVVYLWSATRVVMPWFRSGDEVHYARYFAKFGETPEAIVRTMVSRPGLLFGELWTMSTTLYALMMLAPLAFIPLLSPARMAVGLPLFGILCLNELAKDPRHQFHAPLVAIAFWSVAGGVPRAIVLMIWSAAWVRAVCGPRHKQRHRSEKQRALQNSHQNPIPGEWNGRMAGVVCQHLIWSMALCSGLFFSLSPLGLPFWDSGSNWYWKSLYGPNRRGELWAHVIKLIPSDSRVASTDFVHPRLTHFDRSYDYSNYRRKVADGQSGVPDDTDYIIIDTHHRYSEIKSAAEIPEFRDHPDQWELIANDSAGFFIVLKRKR